MTLEQTAERFRFFANEVAHLPVYARISLGCVDDRELLATYAKGLIGRGEA